MADTESRLSNAAATRGLHVLFLLVWSLLVLSALFAFAAGLASHNQTYDIGPLTHDEQAGVDYLIGAFLGATGVVVAMIQLGVRIVQQTVRDALQP